MVRGSGVDKSPRRASIDQCSGVSAVGGVRPASKSSIEIDFYYQCQRCREKIKLKPTPANLKRATRHREAILHAIEQGIFVYAETFPDSPNAAKYSVQPGAAEKVSNYLDQWLQIRKSQIKASTYVTDRRIVGRLSDQFGDLSLTQVKWGPVKSWLLTQDIGQKTTNNILSVFRLALEDAVDDELIEVNPLAGKKLKRAAKPKDDEIDPFSQDERTAILNAADGQERNLLQFALWTGLRTSELCALDWSDIDFIKGVARVSRALTQASKEAETTKTAAGTRDVKLLPAAMEAIQSQKSHSFLKGKEVFQNPRTGERWTGDLVIRERMWKRILKKAGVRYRYPYQTRHTYASMMLQAGEHVMWVSQQLGHKDWAFTARTYSRFIPDDAPDAGNKAAERWGNRDQKRDQTHVK